MTLRYIFQSTFHAHSPFKHLVNDIVVSLASYLSLSKWSNLTGKIKVVEPQSLKDLEVLFCFQSTELLLHLSYYTIWMYVLHTQSLIRAQTSIIRSYRSKHYRIPGTDLKNTEGIHCLNMLSYIHFSSPAISHWNHLCRTMLGKSLILLVCRTSRADIGTGDYMVVGLCKNFGNELIRFFASSL